MGELVDFQTNLQDAVAVRELFEHAVDAARSARCRAGSVDRISAPGTLLATGDIHDNPVHLQRILTLARLDESPDHHVTFHEVIHGDTLLHDMDFSYRMLARIAELKTRYPEQVHALLGNHELSQIVGSGVIKHGINCVYAFTDAIEQVFSRDAGRINDAIEAFIRSMALALVTDLGILCAHSLPGPYDMEAFDPSILERELTDEDYAPRAGSAHRMVWGRRHTPEQLAALAEQWGVKLFVIGHELAETGFEFCPPNTVILNSDHQQARVLPLDLAELPPIDALRDRTIALHTIT